MNSGYIIFISIYRQAPTNWQPQGWPERTDGTCPN